MDTNQINNFLDKYVKTVYDADNTKGSIAVLNFGGDFTVTSGTFRIVFPSPGAAGLIRID